ncbi:MAG: cobamide remodeling phosphodiesterase CbiR [Anaerolineae bacterium]
MPFPFRLGTTSYIFPAGLVDNVQRLAGMVDDIELILFETETQSNMPTPQVIEGLLAEAERDHLSYTVHFPLDLPPGADDPNAMPMRMAERIIQCTRPLRPWAYIAHLDGVSEYARGPAANWARWRREGRALLERIIAWCGDPHRICVENLVRFPHEAILPLLDELPISFCLDAGHLWLKGEDPIPLFRLYRERVRVIHLHGIRDGEDHSSLEYLQRDTLFRFLDEVYALGYDGVVTLEVVGMDNFFGSWRVMLEWAMHAGAGRQGGRP